MTDKKRMEIVAKTWLTDFGTRCAATMKREDAVLRAADYAKGFSDMPPEVFSDASQEAAAREFEYYPSYATLRKFLSKWWDDNKPRPPALPGSDNPALTTEDRVQYAVWLKHRDEGWAHGKGSFVERMTISLDHMRRWNRRLFVHIVNTDKEAASIAVFRRWEEADPEFGNPREKTPEEIAAVTSMAAAALSSIRAAHAPVPRSDMSMRDFDTARDAAAEAHRRFEAQNGRQIGVVPKERLDALRADNPAVQKARDHQESSGKGWQAPW